MAEAIHRAADGHHPTARHPSPTTSAARRRMGTDFLNSTAVALAEALLALSSRRGVGLHFIQVGANAGDFLQENVHLNQSSDPVRIAVQRLLRHERTRGLLIEPNPPVFKQLDAAVHREFAASGNAARRVSAQNIAVCAHRTGTVDFHTVDPPRTFFSAPSAVREETDALPIGFIPWPVRGHPVTERWRWRECFSMHGTWSSLCASALLTPELDVDIAEQCLCLTCSSAHMQIRLLQLQIRLLSRRVGLILAASKAAADEFHAIYRSRVACMWPDREWQNTYNIWTTKVPYRCSM